jgi:putative FmdB family regulatory protein
MPNYNYACKACGEHFTEFSKIADRNIPTENACKTCGVEGQVQIVITAPAIAAELGGSLKKAGDGWKEVLSKVKEKHVINNIND